MRFLANDKGYYRLWLVVSMIISLQINGHAQRIDNVYPEIEGEKIHIIYDLTGIKADQSVFVKVFMSTDGGETYGDPLRSVSGDVGTITGPGQGNCIIWNVFHYY